MSERKTRRYLNHAIGELILVVFGILTALQINNWNEERLEQRQIADYAHALIKDLERDLAMAAIIKLEIDVLINKIDTLHKHSIWIQSWSKSSALTVGKKIFTSWIARSRSGLLSL